jgi:pantoate--beta-alanine ligase
MRLEPRLFPTRRADVCRPLGEAETTHDLDELAASRDSTDKVAMNRPPVFSTIAELRREIGSWRAAADRIALVPTMGALHAGHISLVEIAQRAADRAIVSIFVNPKQFAPGEDFDRYPRTFEDDLAKLGAVGVDGVFAPAVGEIYPTDFATTVSLAGPAVAGLEDRFRPTHFQGVATVVAKLLMAALPDVAIFGEKDFQQLQVLRRLVADLALPIEVVGAPIAREQDGLALSSRNAYLSAPERAMAPALNAILKQCEAKFARGEALADILEAGRADAASAGFVVDYLELRDAETLAPLDVVGNRPARLLAAAYLGRTRLIDNIAILGLNGATERQDAD